MGLIGRLLGLINRDAMHRIDSMEQHSREISHDLTNVAARLDVLSRLHQNMSDDKKLNGDASDDK